MLADTHLSAPRAHEVVDVVGRDRLGTADVILHAGDVVDAAVLDELAAFAPVHAVDGNNDRGLAVPETLEVDLGPIRVAMIHDSGPASGRGRRLASRFPDADVVVFGHSHLPWHEVHDVDGRPQHHVNPGSPTQRRRAPTRTVAWLDVSEHGRITVEHVDV